ncbi:MAG: hypothetical protein HY788_14745 [Deltaproteobacteria bacterium]|nr:hypothetical protein [Deltaproteobacteria bacterium]
MIAEVQQERSGCAILFHPHEGENNLTRLPIPKPSILDECDYLGAFSGERRWRSLDCKRLYTWDSLHGEIEVFNARGKHLGSVDPVTGALLKDAVRGRTIDV